MTATAQFPTTASHPSSCSIAGQPHLRMMPMSVLEKSRLDQNNGNQAGMRKLVACDWGLGAAL